MATKQQRIKEQTIALYDSLPQEESERKKRTDIRDQIIELNYAFFGFVATHTFISNTSIDYFDKFQSALLHFCECWYWYRWEGHYRTDLSFAVFFKPRISEMIERELSTVKYSTRRTLCLKASEQLGIHWAKLRYEDLANPKLKLTPDEMNSLKAIFGSLYLADIADHELYIDGSAGSGQLTDFEKYSLSDKYDSVVELLIHEMIDEEHLLTDRDLKKMSSMYDIPFELLKANLDTAVSKLYKSLKKSVDENLFIE